MADLATLQTRLAEAEAAYHALLTGSAIEEVEHGDMRQRYVSSATSMQQLSSYIADLRAQIVALGGAVSGERRRGFVIDLPGSC